MADRQEQADRRAAENAEARIEAIRRHDCRRGEHPMSRPNILPRAWAAELVERLDLGEEFDAEVSDTYCMVCSHMVRRLKLWSVAKMKARDEEERRKLVADAKVGSPEARAILARQAEGGNFARAIEPTPPDVEVAWEPR